ncbi:MAG: BlaI/MecI/CopY family transcriptional regulator [Actinomycetota bacterium]
MTREREERTGRILGPLEAEVMRVVWPAKVPVSVREVLARLNEGRSEALAYTTVMTVMTRLADKGVLSRRPEGRGYVYEATVPDEASIAVRGLLRQFGDAAIASLADEARADPKLLRRLERLLREDK